MAKKKSKTSRISNAMIIMGAQLREGDARVMARITKALEKTGGNVLQACEKLEIPHRTFQHWRNDLPALEKEIKRIRKAAIKAKAAA